MREQWVDRSKKRHRASSSRNVHLYLRSARPYLLGCDLGEKGGPQPLLPSDSGLQLLPLLGWALPLTSCPTPSPASLGSA